MSQPDIIAPPVDLDPVFRTIDQLHGKAQGLNSVDRLRLYAAVGRIADGFLEANGIFSGIEASVAEEAATQPVATVTGLPVRAPDVDATAPAEVPAEPEGEPEAIAEPEPTPEPEAVAEPTPIPPVETKPTGDLIFSGRAKTEPTPELEPGPSATITPEQDPIPESGAHSDTAEPTATEERAETETTTQAAGSGEFADLQLTEREQAQFDILRKRGGTFVRSSDLKGDIDWLSEAARMSGTKRLIEKIKASSAGDLLEITGIRAGTRYRWLGGQATQEHVAVGEATHTAEVSDNNEPAGPEARDLDDDFDPMADDVADEKLTPREREPLPGATIFSQPAEKEPKGDPKEALSRFGMVLDGTVTDAPYVSKDGVPLKLKTISVKVLEEIAISGGRSTFKDLVRALDAELRQLNKLNPAQVLNEALGELGSELARLGIAWNDKMTIINEKRVRKVELFDTPPPEATDQGFLDK